MDFLTFKERMYPMGCFNINQVHLLVIESCPDLPLDALW